MTTSDTSTTVPATAAWPESAAGERLLVVSVGARPGFHDAVRTALADATDGPGAPETPVHDDRPDVYQETVRRAHRFLARALVDDEVTVVSADTLAEAAEAVRGVAAGSPALALALLLVDAPSAGLDTDPFADTVQPALAGFFAALPREVIAHDSAYSVHVYDRLGRSPARLGRPYTLKQVPDRSWLLAADVICAFTDQVQYRHVAQVIRAGSVPRRVLAQWLHSFLTARAGDTWGLHYYTGSIMTGLIGELERTAERSGNPVLRGPSEHGLACGALARWQLDEAPFLIVVTNGMVDEFKGTLANLRESRARGFIVCGEPDPGGWFPFQGTIDQDGDSREVLRARRLVTLHLDDPARLPEDLAAAREAYDADEGPVVLLATHTVLNASATGEEPAAPGAPPTNRVQVTESALTPVVRLVNEEPARLLWQCGRLDEEERTLTLSLARSAGIALADSLTRPGTVSRYHAGAPVPNYLGTLGMMGCSARVHAFLHHEGRLRGRADQALFFLKSRITELSTPFPPDALERRLRVVQVTDTPGHIAPFTDHPVVGDAKGFLRALRERLAVDPQVLEGRRRAIEATRDSASDVLHRLPLRPMSPNYFFHQLGELLDELITGHGYTYTGLYEVGRGGISAVRNLPRTGPGFSGWYGRALMGDALQAVPAVAVTRDDNVLAFVGDGAGALVPDIVPTLVQQAVLYGRRPAGNVSVFRLVDGGHSVIRTYRETQTAVAADRQTQVLHLLEPEWSHAYGPLTVSHRHLTDVPREELRERLLRRGAVDLYSVELAHNNEGDGMNAAGALGWQRDELAELAFTVARTTRRRAGRGRH
ncbi:hypothetical protein PZB75_29810 [Streptomyces sp. AM 4-1-1]|uniref:hypothetical protein n=1 Tax=Streptomyces sp. AM 4-1-1 TaxID=3028710 RepID=UPI0023B89394|nr:hypothetical protein [Streptomyces sp. AM 4-1-1]WEH37196.1 hypothetical protein PZB75_29810 [Streptomyces sp. AM 4-1-1]